MPPTQIIRTLNIPSDEEKDALAAASSPSSINPFATIADIGSAGVASLDAIPDVNVPTPTIGHVLKWDGAAWIAAAYNAVLTFGASSFSDNQAATQLIGVGEWLAAGGISFTASYTNGPPTSANIVFSSTDGTVWSAQLNLVTPFTTGASAQATAYPSTKDQVFTFQLTATKGAETASLTTTVTFRNNIKYGVSALTSGWNVAGLAGSYLSNLPFGSSYPLNAGAGEYLLIAFPSTYTSANSNGFVFNSVTCPFEIVATMSVTNSAGYTENYKVYRSTLSGLGSSTLTVSGSSAVINRIYYGTSLVTGGYTESDIEGLMFNIASNTKSRSFSVTAGAGEYIIYALPARLGAVSFSVGGFSGGFLPPATVSVTNINGYTEDYYVYRSDNPSLGATTIEVA